MVKINKNLSVDNLKASVSEKSNIPVHQFKLKWNKKYLIGTQVIENLGLNECEVIEIKLDLKGG